MITLLLAITFLFNDPLLEQATVSAYAIDLSTGKVLIDENSNKSMVPASCMKLVTTGAALHMLGPDKRFQTHLEYDGKLKNGVLHGNLYIRGGGDPCLGSERISPSLSWDKQIAVWVDAIQKLGIRTIEGNVIGDATKWEKALAAPSWGWEDVGNYYGAGASALSFHENSYALTFKPGTSVGEKASLIRTEPSIPALLLNNEVKTGPIGSGDGTCIYGSEFSSVQYVRGTVPLKVPEFTVKGAIPDPATCSAELLNKALQAKNITISRKNITSSKRVLIHTTNSPSIKEIVHWANQKSINLYAEHLLKAIGEVVFKEGSTQAGTKAISEFWKSQKIELNGFNQVDGSGLSRKNLLTTKQLVSILSKMNQSEYSSIFLESLPKQNEHIRAKSGSFSLVRAYAGYAGTIAFAIIINQGLDKQIMQDKMQQFLSYLHTIKG